MVRLHTSLLALAIATGLVLASSDDYERRDDELFERDLDVDEFFGRQYDLLDEPEARDLFELGGMFKNGEEVGAKAFTKGGSVMKVAKKAAKLEHHAGSADKIEKHVKPAVRLEKRMTLSEWSKILSKGRRRPTRKPYGTRRRIVRQLRRR